MSLPCRRLGMCLVVAVLAAIGSSSVAWAQFTSSIEGTVVDPAGARVPGASVAIVNNATGIRSATQTNSTGYFLFPSLPSGTFNVTIAASGFKTYETSNLALELNQRRTLNLTLEVGAQATTMSVRAEAVAVDLSEVRLAGTFEKQQLTDLPKFGQSFLTLVGLTAGITGNSNPSSIFGAEQGVGISANGQRSEQNGFAIDSGTVTSMVRHGRTNMTPNLESISEMQVSVSNYSAESATDAGANVNVLTRGGTNQYHGSAAWYHQNNTFQSRTLFQNVPNPASGRVAAVTRRNEPSGSFGGPVVRNKIFLFATFDVLRQTTGQSNTQTVETPEFANYVKQNFPNNKSAYLFNKYPSIITPNRNFRHVGQMVSPTVNCNNLASPSTLINTPIGSLPCNMNLIGDGLSPMSTSNSGYQWNVRGDYQISSKDRFYATVYRTAEKSFSGGAGNNVGVTRPAFSYTYPTWNWFGNINETHTFSSSVLNEFRATVTRVHGEIQCRECEIPSMNTGQTNGFTGFGMGGPTPFIQNNYEYKDNLSILRGGHSIKAGVQFSFLQSNWKPTVGYQRPSYVFQTPWDWVRDNPFEMNNIGLNPLTGSVYTPDVAERQHTTGWFIQDTWKMRPNFTLTLGLRWENYGRVGQATMGNNVQWRGGDDTWNRLANGANVTGYHILNHADKNNYAPRVAIAWDPFGRGATSIRAGFGIFYDFLPSQLYGGAHYTPPIYILTSASAQRPLKPVYGFGLSGSDPYQFPRPAGLEENLGLDSRNGSKLVQAAITWIDPNLKSSYTPSWNFGIQQALTSTLSIDVNYVGNAGRKLYAKYNMNRYAGALTQPGSLGVFQRINSSFGSISYGQSNFTSSYQGMNLTLRKRMSSGLLFSVAYTFGHAISLADSFSANPGPTDAWNLALDRGSTGVPQRLATSFIYQVPHIRTVPGYVQAVTNGWELSGMFVANAGGYFSISCGDTALTPTSGIVNYGCDYNADGQNNDRPNMPAFGRTLDLSRDNLLNNGVFKVSDFPAPAPGQPGDMAKDAFRNFGNWNLDLAASRNFALPWFGDEKSNLQFRAEAFNAPNRVNLGNINTTMTNANNFGKVTSANNARRFQLSLRFWF